MQSRQNGVYANLFAFADQMQIVDTHEHLPLEIAANRHAGGFFDPFQPLLRG